MFLSRSNATRLLAMTLCASAATASSWLLGDPSSPEAQLSQPTLLGLYSRGGELRDYAHPFGRVAAMDTWKTRTGMLKPQSVYLVRSALGPEDLREHAQFMRTQIKSAHESGLRFLGPTIHQGGAHTPLMGIARYQGKAPAIVPDGFVATEVESAEVHLCLLGLGTSSDGSDFHEAVLQASGELHPEQAIRRATAVRRYAHNTWGTPKRPQINMDQLRLFWPEAVKNLEAKGVQPNSIILAQRVLWNAGDTQIPGPGGTLLKAVNMQQAHQRLRKLYTKTPLPKN